MAITKAKKQDIVAKLTDGLKNATSVVFVKFGKLSVADTSAMRKALKADGTTYYVAKKSLMRRALADLGITGEMPELTGEVAVAWSSTDATAPARGIWEHAKKHKDSLSILGGVFEGIFADAAKMTTIATIPSVPVLRGMFVNVINSPRQRFALALGEVAKLKA
jgi:large subunit ribosomal protein L10